MRTIERVPPGQSVVVTTCPQPRLLGGAVSLINAVALIEAGQAEMVACVYGEAHSNRAARVGQPIGAYGYGYPMLHGLVGAAATHAFHARRHMHLYGTTSEHLGAVV